MLVLGPNKHRSKTRLLNCFKYDRPVTEEVTDACTSMMMMMMMMLMMMMMMMMMMMVILLLVLLSHLTYPTVQICPLSSEIVPIKLSEEQTGGDSEGQVGACRRMIVSSRTTG